MRIENTDVIRLILQFLKENELHDSAQALQEESKVALEYLSNKEKFVLDIQNGNWLEVLREASYLNLPEAQAYDLYETLCIDMAQHGHKESAKTLILKLEPIQEMSQADPARYARLNQACTSFLAPDPHLMAKRRDDTARKIGSLLKPVEPSRLLTLLMTALDANVAKGLHEDPGDTVPFDVFRGFLANEAKEDEEDLHCQFRVKTAEMSHNVTALCLSPNRKFLAIGLASGGIRVFNPTKLRLEENLRYQQPGKKGLRHPNQAAVRGLRISSDSELLASGDVEGTVIVTKLLTGQELHRVSNPTKPMCCSLDFQGLELMAGFSTGKCQVFNGMTMSTLRSLDSEVYLNEAKFVKDRIVLASEDSECRVYDGRAQLTTSFSPFRYVPGAKPSGLVGVEPTPQGFLLATKSPFLFHCTVEGMVLMSFNSMEKACMISCALSAQSTLVYASTDQGDLEIFSLQTGEQLGQSKVKEASEINLIVHSNVSNHLVVAESHTLSLWQP